MNEVLEPIMFVLAYPTVFRISTVWTFQYRKCNT